MPRKKLPPKFKYTVRVNGVLYVKYPLKGAKHRIWRVCREETQTAVDEIIEEIKNDHARILADSVLPETADRFFDYWLALIKDRVTVSTYQG